MLTYEAAGALHYERPRRSLTTLQTMTRRASKTATGSGASMLTIRCGHTRPIEAMLKAPALTQKGRSSIANRAAAI
jgi:hypothetical protein